MVHDRESWRDRPSSQGTCPSPKAQDSHQWAEPLAVELASGEFILIAFFGLCGLYLLGSSGSISIKSMDVSFH
jgi:hypothetical protein